MKTREKRSTQEAAVRHSLSARNKHTFPGTRNSLPIAMACAIARKISPHPANSQLHSRNGTAGFSDANVDVLLNHRPPFQSSQSPCDNEHSISAPKISLHA